LKNTISVLIIIFLLFGVSSLAFINFGFGYNFGNSNSWIFRIGYEIDIFILNADYFLNNAWNINSTFLFNTQMSFSIGPMINILNEFSTSNMKVAYGPAICLNYNQLDAKIGVLADFSQGFQLSNFSENLYTQFRYYVPDPPGMKMKDKLYIELRYFSSRITILVGLLEPY